MTFLEDLVASDGGEGGEAVGEMSNRKLFRQKTPVDAKVLRLITELGLCQDNRAAQRKSRRDVKGLRKDAQARQRAKPHEVHRDLSKVPLQMRMFPLYGDLSPAVVSFLGSGKRDRLRFRKSVLDMEPAAPEGTPAAPRSQEGRRRIPEVCFAGRSNVGKSSLLNACFLTSAARSANKPGVTQEMNVYSLRDQLVAVDLPGYGFAFAKEQKIEAWNAAVERYVSTRKQLKRVFVVIDARHGIKQNDREFIAMLARKLKHSQCKFQVVMNKSDCVNARELAQRHWHVAQELSSIRGRHCVKEVLMMSSRTGAGAEQLTRACMHIAGV